jgi:hypothetical protein
LAPRIARPNATNDSPKTHGKMTPTTRPPATSRPSSLCATRAEGFTASPPKGSNPVTSTFLIVIFSARGNLKNHQNFQSPQSISTSPSSPKKEKNKMVLSSKSHLPLKHKDQREADFPEANSLSNNSASPAQARACFDPVICLMNEQQNPKRQYSGNPSQPANRAGLERGDTFAGIRKMKVHLRQQGGQGEDPAHACENDECDQAHFHAFNICYNIVTIK